MTQKSVVRSRVGIDMFKPIHQGCRLCLEDKKLCKSHVIPGSYFRNASEDSNGKLVHFDDRIESKARVSTKQWSEPLLCEECEEKVGKLEKYVIELIRNSHQNSRTPDGISLEISDTAAYRLFFTLLIWRAAVAKGDAFQKVLLPTPMREQARNALVNLEPLPLIVLTCRVRLLIDRSKGFSQEDLRKVLISPIPRVAEIPYSFLFAIDGLLLEFYCPGVKRKDQKKLGFLSSAKKQFFPSIDIFEVPELRSLLFEGYRKHAENLVNQNVYGLSSNS
jgi:hypothetical protein